MIPGVISKSNIAGFIAPDFCETTGESPLKEGFNIKFINTYLSTVTNNNGTFEIANVPKSLYNYTIRISKPGYLYRDIKNVDVESQFMNIGSADSPVTLWAGDINQDNSINMADVIKIAQCFNANSDDENFKPDYDINKDKTINIADIIIIAKHFNATTDSYDDAALKPN